ncbi:hypothetical protein GN244_ATG03435 [Phytophthora infestans]|uniref:Uncharacterized protein n=1 Tax=Phytophthora infestans TaxID=4787 RepID=A0A833TD96_PHYIN|nr:hypothetical protein GN244_ATG03435 [Phytophthora infestans]
MSPTFSMSSRLETIIPKMSSSTGDVLWSDTERSSYYSTHYSPAIFVLYWPMSKGGIGPPDTKEFCAAMKLCFLKDAISSASNTFVPRRWFEPAAELCTYALDSSGGTLQRPLERTSEYVELFQDKGYIRIYDFVNTLCEHLSLKLLRGTLSASVFHKHLLKWDLLGHDIARGPRLIPEIIATAHNWVFRSRTIQTMRDDDFYRQLHSLPEIPTWPHVALDSIDPPDWDTMWRKNLHPDKYVLPILSEVRFRMQHNGLNMRSKYRYTNNDANCPHGCPYTETVKHLFWSCTIALEVWPEFLDPISLLAEMSITWEKVVYMTSLCFTERSIQSYGKVNFFSVSHHQICSTIPHLDTSKPQDISRSTVFSPICYLPCQGICLIAFKAISLSIPQSQTE